MRLEDDILQSEEGWIDGRFVLEHIKSGPGDGSVFQGIEQGFFINDASPCGIDEDTIPAKSLQDIGIDDVFGSRGSRECDDKDIRP